MEYENAESVPSSPVTPKHWNWTPLLQCGFLCAAVALLFLFGTAEKRATLAITFLSIVLEAAPFMLLGSCISGLIEAFLSRERLMAFLPRQQRRTLFVAAALGLVFPICECAVIPVVRRLLKKGAPLHAAIAYLVAAPIVNPIVFLSTGIAYNGQWRIALLRLALGYGVAVIAGGMVARLFREPTQMLLSGEGAEGCGCAHCHHENVSIWRRLEHAFEHAAADFFDVGRFLIFGAFLAACAHALLSRSFFESYTSWPVVAIPLMMGLAICLNLCSEADAFVAASFRSIGLPFSAQMAFMVLGPVCDLKLVAMYHALFRKRFIVFMMSLLVLLVVLIATVMEVLGL